MKSLKQRLIISWIFFVISLVVLILLFSKQIKQSEKIADYNNEYVTQRKISLVNEKRSIGNLIDKIDGYREGTGIDFNFSYPLTWHVYIESNSLEMNNGPIWHYPHAMSLIYGKAEIKKVNNNEDRNNVKEEYQNNIDGFLEDPNYKNFEKLDWKNNNFETNCYKHDFDPIEPGMYGKSYNHITCYVLTSRIRKNIDPKYNDEFSSIYRFYFSNYSEYEGEDFVNIKNVFKHFIESLKRVD